MTRGESPGGQGGFEEATLDRRLDRHGLGHVVHREDPVHPGQVDHHGPLDGFRPPGEPRAASPGHEGRAGLQQVTASMRAAGLAPEISDDLVATLTYASQETGTKAILAASESTIRHAGEAVVRQKVWEALGPFCGRRWRGQIAQRFPAGDGEASRLIPACFGRPRKLRRGAQAGG